MLHRNHYKPPQPVKPWSGPKPSLDMQVTLVCRVRFGDLQAYLSKVFKMQEYDIKRQIGARGGMTPEFDVTGILPDVPNIWQQVDGIRRGRRTRNLGMILDLLCKDGFISAGKYVIDMSEGPRPLDQYRDALYRTSDPLDIECIRIKEANKSDREFTAQAAKLDKRVMQYKSNLPGESIDG